MKRYHRFGCLALIVMINACRPTAESTTTDTWACQVLPAEHVITNDPVTGAKLIFVTTDTSRDTNLYFDLNSWFADLSMMAFYSNRTGTQELYGYLTETGELVRLQPEGKSIAQSATVDRQTHDVYVIHDNTIYQWNVTIDISSDPAARSKVRVQERQIAAAPAGRSFFMGVTESADGKYLSVGMKHADSDSQDIAAVDIQTGDLQTLYTWTGISHVQFSKYNPNLLRFSNSPHRMWWIDTREPGKANKLHHQVEGELVTHEDWWVDDQMTFCGGYLDEESHVKIVDIKTQTTRIIGAGSWWATGTPKEVSEYNWWHASGSPNGRWVVADNWHGHIAIIDAQTTRLRHLTKGHRIYGGGDHPHVGWAPDSRSVEFSSLMRGNTDVCIAYLPEAWK